MEVQRKSSNSLPKALGGSQMVEKRQGTRQGTTDWFQIGKGVRQGCIVSPCLFNLYAEQRDEAQARIKISMIVNNLRYVMAQPLWQKAKRN